MKKFLKFSFILSLMTLFVACDATSPSGDGKMMGMMMVFHKVS